jgi:hypothetical protein
MKLFIILILSTSFFVVATDISNDHLGVPRNIIADKSYLEKRQNGVGDGTSGSCQGVDDCQNDAGQSPVPTPQITATARATTATATGTDTGENPPRTDVTSGCNRPQTFFILYFLTVFGSILAIEMNT